MLAVLANPSENFPMPRPGTPKVNVTSVVKLTNATCQCVGWPHELYTEHPIDSPAPCLAVGPVENGVQAWQGLVVALPADAANTPIQSPEISAGLGIVRSIANKRLKKLKEMEFVTEFQNRSYREFPFSSFGADVEKTLDRVGADLCQAGIEDPRVFDQIRKTCADLLESPATGIPWSPVVLIDNVHHVEEPLTKHADNWALLRRWQEWLRETNDIEVLHSKFRAWSVAQIVVRESKRRVTASDEDYMRFKAFLKRLDSLGIPHSQKVLNPTARQNELSRRKAVALKSEKRRKYLDEQKAMRSRRPVWE